MSDHATAVDDGGRPSEERAVFSHPLTIRYLEVDQQGVVFNMWYLAYFDDAMTAYLAHNGLPYQVMLDRGYDVQLVHSEIDWRKGVGWEEAVAVQVATARMGRTSFTLEFAVVVGEEVRVTGSTVYVVVGGDGGKRPIPEFMRATLGPVRPLGEA